MKSRLITVCAAITIQREKNMITKEVCSRCFDFSLLHSEMRPTSLIPVIRNSFFDIAYVLLGCYRNKQRNFSDIIHLQWLRMIDHCRNLESGMSTIQLLQKDLLSYLAKQEMRRMVMVQLQIRQNHKSRIIIIISHHKEKIMGKSFSVSEILNSIGACNDRARV
ncbi:PREDICTED: uncharacterized protein LOC109358421 [Lupinus angustifolius]|uniref:uncharacterized protein LOC109358421 n=1 Tax=Lupinus angustifolius TaxID=3871 RepID=UPI00092ED94B|nr:PREDICTED: uncharacterized protein LOC109358421 [Lupinus angustifolius]